MKLCPCDSGLPRRELIDAAGIFCTFVCDECEERKRSHFNPAIFESTSRYATTGEEEDIGSDEEDIMATPEREATILVYLLLTAAVRITYAKDKSLDVAERRLKTDGSEEAYAALRLIQQLRESN